MYTISPDRCINMSLCGLLSILMKRYAQSISAFRNHEQTNFCVGKGIYLSMPLIGKMLCVSYA